MPWKEELNPYKIWLSEIILQQTRVEQGRSYYEKFITTYPDVEALAAAPLDDVLALWEGLGYYSRARNLHYTARYVRDELKGEFPDNIKGLLELKGIGPYTAAAIGSFAFNIPEPVIDGNSLRVVSRYIGSTDAVDTSGGKRKVREFLKKRIPSEEPASFNQAIMDFGATVCTPSNPKCESCPLQSNCEAYLKEQTGYIPVKSKRQKRRKRYFHYLLIRNGDEIGIQKRVSKDIWEGLYQLPLVEKEGKGRMSSGQVKDHFLLTDQVDIDHYKSQKQLLTHQEITAYFYALETHHPARKQPEIKWVKADNLDKFAFPKVVRCFLEEKQLTLGGTLLR